MLRRVAFVGACHLLLHRTAAVVGYIMYVRVASPRHAAASCFRLHEGTILNRTTIKTSQRIFLDSKKQTAVDMGADAP